MGYGKTEIAIRAAFKAVQDGKQVAFLVPTTILAQQHYNTFAQRMKDFPVRIDLMSRFRTAAQQKKTPGGLPGVLFVYKPSAFQARKAFIIVWTISMPAEMRMA